MYYRIEIKDVIAGDWRGLFRAVRPSGIWDIVGELSARHRAPPYGDLDYARDPKFYWTEEAWGSFAYRAFAEIRERLPNDVRALTLPEDALYVEKIDDLQVVVYSRPPAVIARVCDCRKRLWPSGRLCYTGAVAGSHGKEG